MTIKAVSRFSSQLKVTALSHKKTSSSSKLDTSQASSATASDVPYLDFFFRPYLTSLTPSFLPHQHPLVSNLLRAFVVLMYLLYLVMIMVVLDVLRYVV